MRLFPHATTVIIETADLHVVFLSDGDIDCDGRGGNPDHDPFYQPDTTLHYRGRALHAYEERFVVVPPIVVKKTEGIVLGCQALVTNTFNGKTVTAVVGDVGPTRKTGEISCACADALGLSPNPNYGGTSDPILIYEIMPGVAAQVDDRLYDLQPHV